MKKVILMLTTVLLLTACSSDPVFHGLTQQEKENYGQAIAGEYPGRLEILFTDNTQTPAIDGDPQMHRQTIDEATVTVSDYATRAVFIHNFPISLLSRVVDADADLSEALGRQPSLDLSATYEFARETEAGQVSWSLDRLIVPLTVEFRGETHHIYAQFNSGYNYYVLSKGQIESGTAFNQGSQLQLSLSAIYDGDQLVQQFDGVWTSGAALMVVFRFGK